MRMRTILLSNGCVHFEFYILKCKFFLIDFLDELGNFKQKKIYTAKCSNKPNAAKFSEAI